MDRRHLPIKLCPVPARRVDEGRLMLQRNDMTRVFFVAPTVSLRRDSGKRSDGYRAVREIVLRIDG